MFKIMRSVGATKLRQMCIKHNYYTRGDNDEYRNMLMQYHGQDVAEAEIEWLARDIKSHSVTTDEVIDIAFNILTEACDPYLLET